MIDNRMYFALPMLYSFYFTGVDNVISTFDKPYDCII